MLYQLEVKARLVEMRFPPSQGWRVTVDVDAMERCHGGTHPVGKIERARIAEQRLLLAGATIGAHPDYGRVDIAAFHPEFGTFLVEVEGQSSRQLEQAMYSALGQTLLMMKTDDSTITYGLAVPATESWERQFRKIPNALAQRLRLRLFLVGDLAVGEFGTEDASADASIRIVNAVQSGDQLA